MNATALLKDQVVIVTGAAHGIGRAFALGCAQQGARVVVADVREAPETLAAIEQAGAQALYVRCDVADEASVQSMVAQTLRAFGRIDGLINNAAYFREIVQGSFEEIPLDVWDHSFAVNVRGVFLCCKAVMPAMRERKRGSIVNIASVVAVAGAPRYLHYVAAKGAVLGITKGLAKEVGDHGVRVNAIAPGFVITDATANRTPEWRRMFQDARALKREEFPDDLVGTGLYLLSELSGFVTGQTIVVDGGNVMY